MTDREFFPLAGMFLGDSLVGPTRALRWLDELNARMDWWVGTATETPEPVPTLTAGLQVLALGRSRELRGEQEGVHPRLIRVVRTDAAWNVWFYVACSKAELTLLLTGLRWLADAGAEFGFIGTEATADRLRTRDEFRAEIERMRFIWNEEYFGYVFSFIEDGAFREA